MSCSEIVSTIAGTWSEIRDRRHGRRTGIGVRLATGALCCGIAGSSFGVEPDSPITVPNVFLRLGEDIELPAQEAGVLAEMPVEEGRLVEAGETVARIQDDEATLLRDRATLEVAVAKREAERAIEIEYARKALGVAQAELARAERSREAVPGAVSLTEVDRLRLVTEKADAEIRRIEHEQKTAELTTRLKEAEQSLADLHLQRHQITAPIAGQVVEHFRHRGEWVEPGEKVLRLIRLDVLRAEGYLPASQASTELVGANVRLKVATSGKDAKEYAGNVVFVAPEVEPTTGQVLVRAEIENPELALRPGLRAEMVIRPIVAVERDPATDSGPNQ
ncbi:MAG: HlyD family efflux transporter periplasmic adaptor subunit [Planctomycetaceae bacterium]